MTMSFAKWKPKGDGSMGLDYPPSSEEMQAALEADGEKLRQLTGEDHGPEFLQDDPPQQWCVCSACGGSGVEVFRVTVYEHGCGFPHDDSDERPCGKCNGHGGWLDDVEPDGVRDA
jgi:hypothetical protein